MNVGPSSSTGVRAGIALMLSLGALSSVSANAAPLAPATDPSALAAPAVGPGALTARAPSAPVPGHDRGAAATADRAASATRYRTLSAADAVAVGKRVFPELIGRPGWKPLALPGGARVVRYRDADRVAELVDPRGKRVLMASDGPLRAVDRDSGLLAPVDLGLERAGGDFAPVASTTAIAFGADVADGFSVGPVRMTVLGAAGTQPTQVDDTLVWPNALTDTDVVGQVVPGGVELSLTLRSAASPQDIGVRFTLPAGATLRPAPKSGTDAAGLDVVDAKGAVITTITSPAAWDAERVPVASSWEVDGTGATLHVDTLGRDIAWPVAVDPVINDERYNCDLGARPWAKNPASAYGITMKEGDFGWGCGMYQILPNPTWVSFPDGVFSWWELNLSGRPTANVRQVHAENMNHDTGDNAIGSPATCTFLNIWYSDTATEYPWNGRCDSYRGVTQNIGDWSVDNGYRGDKGLIGLHTAGAGTRGYFQQSVGVLVAALGDYASPSASISGPSGWQRSTSATFSASANDTGLGTSRIVLSANGASQTINGQCQTTTLCNPGLSGSATFSSLPDGIRTATATSADPVSQQGNASTTYSIDAHGPQVALSGALSSAAGTSVDAGVYPLTITATDGNAAAPGTAQSGVASINIFVDTALVYSSTQGCAVTNASCSMVRTWNFEPGLYGYGPHTIKVSVADLVGNPPTDRTIAITADCCFARGASAGALPAGEARYGDVNGDDLDDVVVRNVSTGALSVRLAGPTGPGAVLSWGTWPTTRDFNLYDVDGDNREDLVGRDSAGTVSLARSTGSTFAAATTLTTLASSFATMRIGDVDGDARGDVVGENPSTGALEVVLTNGSAAVQRFTPATPWTAGYTFILADVDGDGSDDAVGRNASAGTVKVGFSVATDFETRNGPWTIPANAAFGMADVNGDGLADLLYRPSGSTSVSVRTASQSDTATTFDTAQIWGVWAQTRDLSTADVNGDGLADLVSRDTGDNLFWSAISHGRTPDGLSTAGDDVPAPAAAPAAPQALAAVPLECQNASTMKMAMMDDGRLLYHQNEGLDGALGVQHTAERMATLGVEVVRLTVYWGAHENRASYPSPRYYWDKLDAAVDTITSVHVGNNMACPTLAVHLTLTGQNIRQCDPLNPTAPGTYNSNARDCDGAVPTSGQNPDPTTFGAFVQATVNHFEARTGGKPASYSLWNEPNLPSHRFLSEQATTTGGVKRELLTAAKYRGLYTAGYRAAQTGYCTAHQDPNTCGGTLPHRVNVFIGELSEQTVNGPLTANGSQRKGGYSALDYLYEVLKPPTNGTAPILADGFALHPYQHTQAPDRRGPNRQVGIGKLRAQIAAAVNGSWNRVGVVKALDQLQFYHGTTGVDTDAGGNPIGPNWLRTSTGGKVPLYITEFGYFNLVPGAKQLGGGTVGRTKWKTDSVRGRYFTDARGPHTGVIYEAQVADARWLTIHTLSESGSTINPETKTPWGTIGTRPDYRAGFDTGLISPTWQADWTDVTAPRPYGKGAGVPYTDVSQPRTAYCALYGELKAKHFPTQQTGVPCP
jgi:hypothetical protein